MCWGQRRFFEWLFTRWVQGETTKMRVIMQCLRLHSGVSTWVFACHASREELDYYLIHVDDIPTS